MCPPGQRGDKLAISRKPGKQKMKRTLKHHDPFRPCDGREAMCDE
jgi:hypothetical protein